MGTRATFIRDVDRWEYTLTDEDILWLAKSLWGENGDNVTREEASAVAWTMWYRFIRWPGHKWASFTELVRAFSQPTNPIWLDPQGAKCQQYPQYCKDSHISRRRKIQGASWDQIPESARRYAILFAEGRLPDVLGPHYIDFASTPKAKATGRGIGGNYFLRDDQTSFNWLPGGSSAIRRASNPPTPGTYPDATTPVHVLAYVAWGVATLWAAKKVLFG